MAIKQSDQLLEAATSLSRTYGQNILSQLIVEARGQDSELLRNNNNSTLELLKKQVEVLLAMQRKEGTVK